MKTFLRSLGLSLALVLATFAGPVRAQDNIDDQTAAPPDAATSPDATAQAPASDSSVSFQTFYDQLADKGSWIKTDKFGYVFQPTETDPNWRPYTYGHWVSTDSGMTWVSDDSFGWATDHYGRWTNLDGSGWVWVPGYTWAPAWVSWRQGDDEVGWAPLPPDSDVGIDYYGDDSDFNYGFHIGDDCDVAYGIGPWWYNFCPIVFIGDRDCWRHFRDRRDNFGFIGRTRNLTNINFRRDGAGRFGRVRAEGPSVAALNARAHTPIQNVRLTSASTLNNAGLHGDRLSVFAPRVNASTRSTAHPANVSQFTANTNVNRGTDINRTPAVNSRVSAPGATTAQIHAAAVAQGAGLANARVATIGTHATRAFTGSLNATRVQPRTSAVATPSRNVSAFTGQGVTRSSVVTPRTESRFTGEGSSPRVFEPSRSTRVFNTAPSTTFRSSDSFRASEPAFHSSAPAYHPQTSFRSFAPSSQSHFSAPVSHFSGGGVSHASSGGFSGGGRSGGGGGHGGGGHR